MIIGMYHDDFEVFLMFIVIFWLLCESAYSLYRAIVVNGGYHLLLS